MKTTIVKNVITEKKSAYYNRYDLEENMISEIISINKEMGNLLNPVTRNFYREKVEMIPSKKGGKIAYSQDYDLIAYNQ